jgi:nucleotide-binding universal stress UspA family protein
MKILVAVDESGQADRMVRYVGTLLKAVGQAEVTLFHVLKPMPRRYLEHGGSENPQVEGELGRQLRKEQDDWYRKEQEAECGILTRARETLAKTGFPAERVVLKFGYEEDVARNIVEEAQAGGYDTIVIGRQGASGKSRIFGGGVADDVLRQAKGLAVWIID